MIYGEIRGWKAFDPPDHCDLCCQRAGKMLVVVRCLGTPEIRICQACLDRMVSAGDPAPKRSPVGRTITMSGSGGFIEFEGVRIAGHGPDLALMVVEGGVRVERGPVVITWERARERAACMEWLAGAFPLSPPAVAPPAVPEYIDYDVVCQDTGRGKGSINSQDAAAKSTSWRPLLISRKGGKDVYFAKLWYRVELGNGERMEMVAVLDPTGATAELRDSIAGHVVGSLDVETGEWSLRAMDLLGKACVFAPHSGVVAQYFSIPASLTREVER